MPREMTHLDPCLSASHSRERSDQRTRSADDAEGAGNTRAEAVVAMQQEGQRCPEAAEAGPPLSCFWTTLAFLHHHYGLGARVLPAPLVRGGTVRWCLRSRDGLPTNTDSGWVISLGTVTCRLPSCYEEKRLRIAQRSSVSAALVLRVVVSRHEHADRRNLKSDANPTGPLGAQPPQHVHDGLTGAHRLCPRRPWPGCAGTGTASVRLVLDRLGRPSSTRWRRRPLQGESNIFMEDLNNGRTEMVGEAGIEPTTPSLEGSCSIQLSYSPARSISIVAGKAADREWAREKPCCSLGKRFPRWSKSIVVDGPVWGKTSLGFVVSCGELQVPSWLCSAYRRMSLAIRKQVGAKNRLVKTW